MRTVKRSRIGQKSVKALRQSIQVRRVRRLPNLTDLPIIH